MNPATGSPYITQSEAIAAVASGVIPKEVQALIDQLPAAQQFAVTMLISGATAFERANPVVAQLGQIFGMAKADLDALWMAAAAIP